MAKLSDLWNWAFSRTGLAQWVNVGPTASKVYVDESVALQTTAFLRAIRVIAEGVGMMPLKLYDEQDEGGATIRKVARDHESYRTICYEPCWLTRAAFVETLTMQAAVLGDGYAVLNRGMRKGGPILEMIPVDHADVRFSIDENWRPRYHLAWKGFSETYGPGEMFHLRGPSWDGRIGMETLENAREAIGLSRALEQSHASLMGSETRPAGVLSTEQSVTPETAEKIRERWRENYGPGGKKGVAVLDNGFTFKTIQMSAVDAQFIENRKFQIEEIARATGVFPQMLMHSDKTSTFASAREFFAAHVTYTLQPWVIRWEEALKRDCLGWEGANEDIWPRFSMEGLLRSAPKDRGEFYRIMVERGILSPNEVRVMENLNPREGGDEYLTPMNMRVGNEDPTGEGGEDE